MTLRALAPLTIRFDGKTVQIAPGACFIVSDQQAQRLFARVPGKVEVLDLPLDLPVEPLQSGWLVCYRDRLGRLAGGCDDRQGGTVQSCTWDGGRWTVLLTNGQSLPLALVRSVAKTDHTGRVLSAWTVREHGCDGEGRRG